jgi:hypothetical protein
MLHFNELYRLRIKKKLLTVSIVHAGSEHLAKVSCHHNLCGVHTLILRHSVTSLSRRTVSRSIADTNADAVICQHVLNGLMWIRTRNPRQNDTRIIVRAQQLNAMVHPVSYDWREKHYSS